MKTPSKKTEKAQKIVVKPGQPELRPTIDYPRQNDTLVSRHYSVRVTVDEKADQVDLSIDQGTWRPCRRDSGHWWFDWVDFDKGEHEVIARARQGDGRWMVSLPHEFMVV